jgi:hypothetical protein
MSNCNHSKWTDIKIWNWFRKFANKKMRIICVTKKGQVKENQEKNVIRNIIRNITDILNYFHRHSVLNITAVIKARRWHGHITHTETSYEVKCSTQTIGVDEMTILKWSFVDRINLVQDSSVGLFWTQQQTFESHKTTRDFMTTWASMNCKELSPKYFVHFSLLKN